MKFPITDTTNTSILVVEPTGSVRMMIMEVLRSLGYSHVQGVSSGRDACVVLETEEIGWVIMPLMAGEPVNAMQIIKLMTQENVLRNTATTLILDPSNEDYCLPLAFELGLLSWMPKSYVKDSLSANFQELLKCLHSHQNNFALTAADYLRKHLTDKKMYESRVALEQNLLSVFPGSGKILVNMAEAEVLFGNAPRAWGLLNHAELIDERLAGICKHLKDKHFKGVNSQASALKESSLGIKNIMIIDPDTDVLHAVSEMLKELGVESVETFENGAVALEWLTFSTKEPELILMEWRIPGISGPMLVQRIRHAGFAQVPIIVSSSLIKKDEKPLLAEMGVDEVLEKPFDRNSFFSTLIWAIQQNKLPTEQKSLERKFRRLLQANQKSEAESILAQLTNDNRIDEGTKKGLHAELLYERGNFKGACKLGVEALKIGGNTLSQLNLLAKSLLKLNQFEKALQCFEKANSICPINIERLIAMSEINLSLGRKQEALNSINPALALDWDNGRVKEAKLKVDLEMGNVASARKIASALETVPRIASYVNNRAIALSRSGRYDESIVLYKHAIECLEQDSPNIAILVKYNLSLAYARNLDYASAIALLTLCTKSPIAPIHKKIDALLQRIRKSEETGDPLFNGPSDNSLDEDSGPLPDEDIFPSTPAGLLTDIMVNVSAKRGDLGCFLIFHNTEAADPKNLALLAKSVHFKNRRNTPIESPELESTGT